MEKLRIVVDDKGHCFVYMNDEEVKGIRSIEFNYDVDDVPYHKIEFISQIASIGE